MKSAEPLFSEGQPNPELAGRPIRPVQSGSGPSPSLIEEAAQIVAQPVHFTDGEGFEREIIAASPKRLDGAIAYVTTSAIDIGPHLDVSIRFHIRDGKGTEVASEIRSYNPFFGCDVRHLDWLGDFAVLIYREKHNCYAATCEPGGEPIYEEIADYWLLNDDVIGFWKYKEALVHRLALPSMTRLEDITEDQARALNLLPPKRW
jgi:hypothetical protein